MSDIKISQLNSATDLQSSDLFPVSKSLGGGKWESKSINGLNLLHGLTASRVLTVANDGIVDANNIKDAITLALAMSPTETNPVAIQVYPGSYYEDNPITIPEWVSIYSQGGQYAAGVVANNDGAIFISNGNSLLDGFSIMGLLGFSNIAYKALNNSSPGQINNCIIINCHTGLLSDNGSITANAVSALSMQRVVDKFISSVNGGFIAAIGCNLSGVMTNPVYGYYCYGSGSEMYLWDCIASKCVNGLYTNNVGYTDCFSGHFEDCTNAIHIGSTGASHVRCVSTIIEDSVSKDLFIESPTATLSYVGAFDSSKFSIVSGATVSSQANDKNTGGGLSIGKSTSWDAMNIGTPGAIELGRDINVSIGEGASFVNDQYGNPIVEYWAYNASAPLGSRFTRFANNAGTQLTGSNDAIIIGCKYLFPAIKLDVDVAMVLADDSTDYLVAEYWNGSTWVGIAPSGFRGDGGVACYKRDDYTRRNNHLFKHVETEYVEVSHTVISDGNWSDDINIPDEVPLWDANEPFYAIRFRNQQALTTGMTFTHGAVKPNSVVFSSSGDKINFGVYRTKRSSYFDSSALSNSIDCPVSFTNIQVTPHISYKDVPLFTKSNANVANVSSMSFAFTMPYDIDTSSPVDMLIDCTAVSASLGSVASTIYISRVDSKNPPASFPLSEYEIGPQITDMPGIANGFVTISQSLDISNYGSEDIMFLSFSRIPDEGRDDYTGDLIVGDITLIYTAKFV